MKRIYLIGLAVLVLCKVGFADNVPIYTPEKILSHTMVIEDMDSTHANGHPWLYSDSAILGPVFLDPNYNSWRRSVFLDQDTIFAGDTIWVIGQTAPYRHLTARGATTALAWTMVDSAELIVRADTVLQLAPRFQLDSLGTVGWNMALWYRVIIRHRGCYGFTGAGAGTPTVPAAADSAIVGNTYKWRFQYFLLPTNGGSKDTY